MTSRKKQLVRDDKMYLIHGSYRGYAIFGCTCKLCTESRLEHRWRNDGKRKRRTIPTIVDHYLSDLEEHGESRVRIGFNRKCPYCSKQVVPTYTFKHSRFPVPVTRGRVNDFSCLACQKNPKVVLGQPCKICGMPMRPSAMKKIPNTYTVRHATCGVCDTCHRRKRRESGKS